MRNKALLLALFAPLLARADDTAVTSTTLLSGQKEARDGQLVTTVPLLELLSLETPYVENPWVDDLSLTFSAWGQLDPGDPQAPFSTGDVDLAYLNGSLREGKLRFRLGRQLAFSGSSQVLHLDGLKLNTQTYNGVKLSAFGGAPVTERFGIDRGDGVIGGKASYRIAKKADVGASFLYAVEDGRLSRNDAGVDLRFLANDAWTFYGAAFWSLYEARLSEAELVALWQPLSKRSLQVSFDARRTAPDLFLSRSSVLSVFSEESRNEIGARLQSRILQKAQLSADLHLLHTEGGPGSQGALKLSRPIQKRGSLGTEVRYLKLVDDGYYRLRAYAALRASEKLNLSLSGEAYTLLQPMNGVTQCFTSSATAGYTLSPRVRLFLSGSAGETPFLESYFEASAKLVYLAKGEP